MSVKHSEFTAVITNKGRFDYDSFYKHLYDAVVDQGYTILEESHSQKEKGNSDKVEVEWGFERIIDDYTKFVIKVKLLSKSVKKVIIKRGDKEVKTNEADVKVRISSEIITDYNNKWERSVFFEKLRDFYERYLFKGTFNNYEVTLYKDVYSIAGSIKEFFNAPHFL